METGQEARRPASTSFFRSYSVGNDGTKRKERSSVGAGEPEVTKRRMDSTAYVIKEALDTAILCFARVEKVVKENKNTHRDVKDAVGKLGKAMEVLSRDSTRKWIEDNQWEKVEIPKYDADCQTDPLMAGVSEGTQTGSRVSTPLAKKIPYSSRTFPVHPIKIPVHFSAMHSSIKRCILMIITRIFHVLCFIRTLY